MSTELILTRTVKYQENMQYTINELFLGGHTKVSDVTII